MYLSNVILAVQIKFYEYAVLYCVNENDDRPD